MERRRAVIAAAAASLTLLAGAAAISLNTGIVGASGDDGVGQISPVDPAPTSGPVTVDDPATGASTGSYVADDDHGEDAEGTEVGDDHGDDGYEQEHEYEGADDDD